MNDSIQSLILAVLMLQGTFFASIREHPQGFIVRYDGTSGTLAVGLNGQLTKVLKPHQSITLHPHKQDSILLAIQNPDSAVAYIPIANYGLRGNLVVDGSFHKTWVGP